MRIILAMAHTYKIVMKVNRDSEEQEIMKAYRKVALKTHPDKGGKAEDFKVRQAAKEEWDTLRQTKSSKPRGRRYVPPPCKRASVSRPTVRGQSSASNLGVTV